MKLISLYKFKKYSTLIILLTVLLSNRMYSQNSEQELKNSVKLVFGMNQLLIDGFNVEANVFYKRLAFDYSHGFSLDFSNSILTGDVKDQKLEVHIPYSTGFGIGYRFNDWFNLRLEPKWHKFEVYYDGDVQNDNNQITSYSTFTLGIGAYFDWKPFKNSKGFLKGITIAPSVRYWPKISSDLDDDKISYFNKKTNKTETHEAMEIGMGNTPFFINVSIGYSIDF